MTIFRLLVLSVFASSSLWAEAALVRYDFNYLPARDRLRPGEVSSSLTASDISSMGIGGGVGTMSVFFFKPTSGSARTYEDAVKNEDYLEFSVAPSGASSVNLGSLRFNYGGENSTASPPRAYTATFFVLSSVDDFTHPIGEPVSCVISPGAKADNVPNVFSVDLQKMEQFRNLRSQVTFRIYCFISEISGKFAETMRPRIDLLQLEAAP